jgi:hypothetical protein
MKDEHGRGIDRPAPNSPGSCEPRTQPLRFVETIASTSGQLARVVYLLVDNGASQDNSDNQPKYKGDQGQDGNVIDVHGFLLVLKKGLCVSCSATGMLLMLRHGGSFHFCLKDKTLCIQGD